jgi:hypothetical protein
MRDIVYNELMKAYAVGDFKSDPARSSYAADVNSIVADQITEYLSTPGRDFKTWETICEVRNIIWVSWAGGSTAEAVAERICELL